MKLKIIIELFIFIQKKKKYIKRLKFQSACFYILRKK